MGEFFKMCKYDWGSFELIFLAWNIIIGFCLFVFILECQPRETVSSYVWWDITDITDTEQNGNSDFEMDSDTREESFEVCFKAFIQFIRFCKFNLNIFL